MSRKSQSDNSQPTEVEYDADGTRWELDPLPEETTEFIFDDAVEILPNQPIISDVPQLAPNDDWKKHVRTITMYLTRCPDFIYEKVQYGNCVFTLNDVLDYCYRLDLDVADADIKKEVANQVRMGRLERMAKGKYTGARKWQQSVLEGYYKAFAELNPTKR